MRHERPTLYVMARLPVAGAVKTRLARQIGVSEATRRYRALLAATLRATRDWRWRTALAVTPASSAHFPLWRKLAPGVPVLAQARGGLAEKMAGLLALAGRAPAAVIGTDILDLEARHVAASFARLKGADAVLSPASDGGFWFCAVRGTLQRFPRRGPGAFAGIAWSRADTEIMTRRALERAGFRVATGPERADLDEI